MLNDTIGNTPVVLVANRGIIEVDGRSLRTGEVNYTAGSEVRVYNRGGEYFNPSPENNVLLDENGQSWQITEEALVGPNGKSAPRISGHLAYWFGWYAMFPNTLIYE